MKKIIGIEIGSDSVKLASVSGGKIEKMAFTRLPENIYHDGHITAPDAFAATVRTLMKDNQLRAGACALVLPQNLVISHHVSVPAMPASELELNLPFEFKDFVGKDADKYVYDYSVARKTDSGLDLYAAAVLKSDIEEYASLMRKAGLTLKVAIPKEMAWLNLINSAKNMPKSVCIVDLGHSATNVDIFCDGNFVMGRKIDNGGKQLDEVIAGQLQLDTFAARIRKEANYENILASDACTDSYGALAVEVMRVISFYNYSHSEDNNKVEDVYFCGGGSNIEALRIAIVKATTLTAHRIQRLFGDEGDHEDDKYLRCALAAGAAMQD